jgi:hypothetical protein
MRILLSIILITAFTTNSIRVYGDTIDVWTVKLNGKPIINSNQFEISSGHPMMIDLSTLADSDTLDICFWTDTGTQTMKWDYIFKDTNNNFLSRFTNPIDKNSTDKVHELHEGFISYRVGYLKNLCREKNIKTINVEFEFGDINYKGAYSGVKICIISML